MKPSLSPPKARPSLGLAVVAVLSGVTAGVGALASPAPSVVDRALARPAAAVPTASAAPIAGDTTALQSQQAHAAAGITRRARSTTGRAGLDATPWSPTGRYRNGALLMNGRLVTPQGRLTTLGDFPLGIAVSPDQHWAVVSNSGQGSGATSNQGNESLQVVDLRTHRVVQTVTDAPAGKTYYQAGVAFSPDGQHLFATGGGSDDVYNYAFHAGRLTLAASWRTTSQSAGPALTPAWDLAGYPRSLAVTPDGSTLVVANEQGQSVVAMSSSTGAISWQTPLATPGSTTVPYPESVAVSADGATAYVADEGANEVVALSTASGTVLGRTPVGLHPAAIALSGHDLYVANSDDDSLSVVDVTQPMHQVQELSTHVFAGEANGSGPNGVAVDPARGLVYVTNSGDNAVAVFGSPGPAPEHLRLLGFLPIGFYPSAAAVLAPSGRLLAVAAKGYGGVPVTSRTEYDGNDMHGLLSDFAAPSASDWVPGTTTALSDMTFSERANALRDPHNPIPDAAHAGQSPIKHVVMVVRENRTFDQVFGDLGQLGRHDADADPAYLEFPRANAAGQTITPNAHGIAAQFGLSDNFYSDGDASIQGHHWTTQSYSNDFTEKSWGPSIAYSSRNRGSDEGALLNPRCSAIFHQLAAAGRSFRIYGEVSGINSDVEPVPSSAPGEQCAPGQKYDPQVASNLDAETRAGGTDAGTVQAYEQEYAAQSKTGTVPAFSYMWLLLDHTLGTAAGAPTPQANVANNDQAIGELIDFLSKQPEWSSTLVMIEEDDSQDGLDHEDGHRNIVLMASPYVRHGVISHLHISQPSVNRIAELVLGLPPISSYAQTAPVPYDMFTAHPSTAPFTMSMPTYPQTSLNPPAAAGTASAITLFPEVRATPTQMTFDPELVDRQGPMLEAQIWEATRPDEPMPAQLIAELSGTVGGDMLRRWGRTTR